MILIGRFSEGVSLNGYEYILTEDGSDVRKYNTIDEAVEFLNNAYGSLLTYEEWEENGIYFIDEENA